MRRIFLTVLSAAAGLIGVATIGVYLYERPTQLTVAIPRGGDIQKLFALLNQDFARGREDIRFLPILAADAREAAKIIDDNKADLAVVRSDIAMPQDALTALILDHTIAVLVAPPGFAGHNFADLNHKTVGIVETEMAGDADRALFSTLIGLYAPPDAEIGARAMSAAQAASLFRSGAIDAAFAFGPVDAPHVAETVRAASEAGPPVFIPILEGDALAEKFSGLEARDILRGSFGGAPPRPPENIATFGATLRLVARENLDNNIVGEVTRLVLAYRGAVAAKLPFARHIEAPSTDKSEILLAHPGAAAYLDDEEQSFFDKYSDIIYIGAMVGSVLISGLATLASRLTASSYARFDHLIEQALLVLKKSREADDAPKLAALEAEIDEILTGSLAAADTPKLDSHQLAALSLAIQQARLAIAERRAEIFPRAPSS